MNLVIPICLVIGFKFLYPFFVRYYAFPDVKDLYVNLLLVAIFLYVLLVYPFLKPDRPREPRPVRVYLAMFLTLFAWILLCSLFNYEHWFIMVKAMIEEYFPYLLLFYVIARVELTPKEQGALILLCYCLILLQVPFVVLQYLFGDYATPDAISGTVSSKDLGGTGINGVLGAFLFSACLARMILTGFSVPWLLVSLVSFVPAFLGGSRFGLILIGASAVLLFASHLWVERNVDTRRVFKAFAVVTFVAAAGFALFVAYSPKYEFAEFVEFETVMDPDALMQYDSDEGSQRLTGYVILVKYVLRDAIYIVFGLGPGSKFGSREFGVRPSYIYERFFPLGAPDSIDLMLTIGVVGLAIVLAILFYGVVWIRNYLRSEPSLFMQVQGLAFIPITFACMAAVPYTLVWSSQIGLVYWVFAGVLMNRYGELPRREW